MKNPSTVARTAALVGRTPRSAADAPVGLLAPCKLLISSFRPRQRDEGVPRGRQCIRATKPHGGFSALYHLARSLR